MLDRNGLAKAAATALTGGYPSKPKGIDRAAVTAILGEIERQGYVVVPREPTEGMIGHGVRAWEGGCTIDATTTEGVIDIWTAMIAAHKAGQ